MRHFERYAQPGEKVRFTLPPHVPSQLARVISWEAALNMYVLAAADGRLYHVVPELVRPVK